jgi:hypothetical protein
MFHQTVLPQLLDVGHVNVGGLGVDGDHVAAVALLDEAQHHILADSAN